MTSGADHDKNINAASGVLRARVSEQRDKDFTLCSLFWVIFVYTSRGGFVYFCNESALVNWQSHGISSSSFYLRICCTHCSDSSNPVLDCQKVIEPCTVNLSITGLDSYVSWMTAKKKLLLLSRSIVLTAELQLIIADGFSIVLAAFRRSYGDALIKKRGRSMRRRLSTSEPLTQTIPSRCSKRRVRRSTSCGRSWATLTSVSRTKSAENRPNITFSLSLFSWAPRCVRIWCVHFLGVRAVSSRRALRLPHVGRHVIGEEDPLHHATDFRGRWLHSLPQHRPQRLEAREHSPRRQFERQDHRLWLC